MANGNKKTGLSRRAFLKSSAASVVIATTISPGSALKALAQTSSEPIAESVFSGVCRGNCGGGCFLNVHVRDGKVVRTSARDLPNPDYNRICIKGLTHMHRIYHPERLKYPLKRTGARGEGKWERISWDEAIATISDKWKTYQSEFGAGSVGIYTGSGNYGVCSGESIGAGKDRLRNSLGMTGISASVDQAIGQGTTPIVGIDALFTCNESADFVNAKTIIVWGANPVHSQQQNTHFLLTAKERGAKLIVIDPIYTTTASKADIYLPIRPGSDAILAMALINIVIRENWVDKDFMLNHTVAPFLVKKSTGKFLRLSDLKPEIAAGSPDDLPVVRGQDGQVGLPGEISAPVYQGSYTVGEHEVTCAYSLLLGAIAEYTPEKAAEMCRLPLSQIEDLARLYATNKPSIIYHYFGINHWVNGHYGYSATATLTALTGNFGKSGSFTGMNETIAGNFINFGVMFPPGAPGTPVTLPILKFPEILATGKYGDLDVNLKAMYVSHANLIANSAQRKTVIEQLDKIEFLVVADINMNETAQYADILLPAAHWFEQEEAFVVYSTHPYVLYQEKCCEPLYESKADYDIYTLLAQAMGRGDLFALSKHEYIKEWLNTDAARGLGLTLENLLDKKALRMVPEDYIFAKDGIFPTSTGRAQFYIEDPTPNYNMNQAIDYSKEHLPHWEPPNEGWHDHPQAQTYPFVLINVHPKWHTHSQWWDVEVLKEIDPEPTLHINPADAARYGIREGMKVRAYNDRGFVVARANLNNGVQPGCLTVPKGWEKQQWLDGHYQDLTSNVCHPMVANSAFFDVLVQIEKA